MLERVRNLFREKYTYKSVSWKITENCNSRCATCIHWKTTRDNELTLDEVKGIIDDIGKMGIKWIRITGGEPLLRNDLQLIIDYINDSDMKVNINTNGLLPLDITGVNNWFVALDGVGETYRKIRGVDSSELVIHNLKAFNYFRNGADVILSMILMKSTLEEIPKVIEVARNINAKLTFNLIDSSPYFFSGDVGGFNKSEMLNTYEWEDAIDYLHILYEDNEKIFLHDWETIEMIPCFYTDYESEILCPIVKENIKIGSMGEIYPCWSCRPIGNLRECSLDDLVNSSVYKTITRALYNHSCNGCTCGWGRRIKYHIKERYRIPY